MRKTLMMKPPSTSLLGRGIARWQRQGLSSDYFNPSLRIGNCIWMTALGVAWQWGRPECKGWGKPNTIAFRLYLRLASSSQGIIPLSKTWTGLSFRLLALLWTINSQVLLKRGAMIEARSKNFRTTPLHQACYHGHIEIVKASRLVHLSILTPKRA